MTGRLLPYGDRAWLVDGVSDPVAVARTLRGSAGAAEVVVGARTVLLRFAGPKPDLATVESALRSGETGAGPEDEPETQVIGVTYDGADLADVAAAAGLATDEVVRLHTSVTYRTAFLGFAPGFAYLTGLPVGLRLPRRTAPRLRVPAGSVAIAHEYTAVYPRQSPGGWLLLGRTSERLFDLDRDPPCRLAPGTLVRFQALP